jgi:hypothetical protein
VRLISSASFRRFVPVIFHCEAAGGLFATGKDLLDDVLIPDP